MDGFIKTGITKEWNLFKSLIMFSIPLVLIIIVTVLLNLPLQNKLNFLGLSISLVAVAYLGYPGLESWESYNSKWRPLWSDAEKIGQPGDWLYDRFNYEKQRSIIGFFGLAIGFFFQIIAQFY